MKKLITLLLVLTGCVCTASAAAGWVGAGVINVNGTWYRADDHSSTTWATSGFFSGKNLGSLATLQLGGQVQLWDTNSADWGSSSTAKMIYKIDGGDAHELTLTYWKFQDNNNFFQSGGSDYAGTAIDISGLDFGAHTLTIKFVDVDNLKPTSEYSATFTKVIDITGATVTGVNSSYEWTGSTIHPVPVVTVNETVLSSTDDYNISYSEGCTDAGNYSVTITGKGNYIGSEVVDFKINPGYYVAGIGGSWAINPNYRLSKFDNVQYVIHDVVMNSGNGIKIISSTNGSTIQYYYPNGSDNNYNVSSTNSYTIYFRPDGQGGDGWHHGCFYVTPTTSVNVTLAPTGYGTYYNSVCGATLPAGAKAYILKDDAPTYEMIADGDDNSNNTVPAGTAILLSGSSPVTLALSTSITGSVSGNMLQGSDVSATTTGGSVFYKLTYGSASGHESQFGWYYGADGGAAFTSPAHKAWLALPTLARSFFGLPDDDNTTGISSVETKQPGMKNVWYDLNGRRVIAPTSKGIYVKDGRKVVIK